MLSVGFRFATEGNTNTFKTEQTAKDGGPSADDRKRMCAARTAAEKGDRKRMLSVGLIFAMDGKNNAPYIQVYPPSTGRFTPVT